MAARNYAIERADHAGRQTRANTKIKLLEDQCSAQGERQRADERQLMNEMRGNKAAVDFNRALFDYEAERGTVSRP